MLEHGPRRRAVADDLQLPRPGEALLGLRLPAGRLLAGQPARRLRPGGRRARRVPLRGGVPRPPARARACGTTSAPPESPARAHRHLPQRRRRAAACATTCGTPTRCERRLNGALYHPPALESPLAVQGSAGGAARRAAPRCTPAPQPVLAASRRSSTRRAAAWIGRQPPGHARPRCAWRRRSAPSPRRAGAWGASSGGRPQAGPRRSCWTRWKTPADLRVPEGVRVVRARR